MTDEHLVHTTDELDVATRLRVEAGTIVATAISGSSTRTTPETLAKWTEVFRKYLETGIVPR